jgi:hypothetical protein
MPRENPRTFSLKPWGTTKTENTTCSSLTALPVAHRHRAPGSATYEAAIFGLGIQWTGT